jgi:hypothetical protein
MAHEKSAAKLLDTAVDILESTGWCRGSYGDISITKVDQDGEHCAMGALYGANSIAKKGKLKKHLDPTSTRPLTVALEALARACDPARVKRIDAGDPYELEYCIIDYNDSLGADDKNKLIRRFKKAAKALRDAVKKEDA